MEKVATPGAQSIAELAELLSIPKAKTAKAVFYVASVSESGVESERFVFAVIRGDMEINEANLCDAIQADVLRPALEEEIKAIGAVPGYASPIGVQGALVVVDDSIADSPNLVAGANLLGWHMRNVNYGRDFTADVVADIALAEAGFSCPQCGVPLQVTSGVSIGGIFQLGVTHSEATGSTFLDAEGKSHPIFVGAYGVVINRLLVAVAEQHHDDKGLCLPISVAPYHVHLVSIHGAEGHAEALYELLISAGIEVLYDDRNERPGVKFNDADLIGLPLRITVGLRAMEAGGYEYKLRTKPVSGIFKRETVVQDVQAALSQLFDEIDRNVKPVIYL